MQVEGLLNNIPTLFEGTQVQENCMAAATQAAMQTLKVCPCSGPASPTDLCLLPPVGLPCLIPCWVSFAFILLVSSAACLSLADGGKSKSWPSLTWPTVPAWLSPVSCLLRLAYIACCRLAGEARSSSS